MIAEQQKNVNVIAHGFSDCEACNESTKRVVGWGTKILTLSQISSGESAHSTLYDCDNTFCYKKSKNM